MPAENNLENGLNSQQGSLVAISAFTAVGNLDKLKIALENALNAGVSINEIKEALVQLYAYCGFPRSLNALGTFQAVLKERTSKGIKDTEGKAISTDNNVADKYEQGRKVLETLTNTPQSKPAPGFGEFAPRIDAFLKEHLFADIFASDVLTYQQRELVTISTLASLYGTASQLEAHIKMGLNTGISESQLIGAFDLIEEYIGKSQADEAKIILTKIVSKK